MSKCFNCKGQYIVYPNHLPGLFMVVVGVLAEGALGGGGDDDDGRHSRATQKTLARACSATQTQRHIGMQRRSDVTRMMT